MGNKAAILIVGGGILQISAVIKAKELGYVTYVTDLKPNAPAFSEADHCVVLSTRDIEGHKKLALELKEKANLKGVYTQGTDVEVTVAETAKYVGLPGISPEAARNCNNKYLTRKKLEEVGINRPKFELVKGKEELLKAIEKIGLPVIIKPLDNSASRGIKRIDSMEEIDEVYEEALKHRVFDEAILVEEFLKGVEYSVDTVVWDGKVYPAGISDREFDFSKGYALQTGSITPSLLPENIQKEMYDVMQKAATAVGVDKGAFKGDLIVVDNKVLIIEVTARTSGGFDSQYRKPYSFGIDILKATIDIACGKPLDFYDLVPKWVKWSKTFTKFHAPGKIKKINGVEEVLKDPNVKNVFFTAKEGDVIKGYKHCADRTNHIIATGNTLEELNATVSKVLNTLDIEVE